MRRLRFQRVAFFVLLLLAVTMPALVPGQQYTGVKSVSPSASGTTEEEEVKTPEKPSAGSTSGISARSIDKYEANELPEGDSKIIKLQIKQAEPQVTSGLRGGRNLGFSADASLNAIPGSLNNELTNGDFKPPVTPASTVAKDSYGNPVTPYTELGTTGLDSAGFSPDINRDSLQGSKNNQYNNLNFKLPSYASGIIEPVLLPPIAPAFFQPMQVQTQFTPQQTTTIKTPTTTPFQFVANAKIPTVDEGQIFFAQKPLNGLIPPLFPGEQQPMYKLEIGTERSPLFVRDPFVSPSLDKGLTLPHDKPPVNFNQGSPQNTQVPLQVPLSLAPLPPQQAQPPQHHQASQQPQFHPSTQSHHTSQQPQYHPSTQSFQTSQQPQYKPTQAPVQKFTGSFGGAPGLLGNQQNLGTAYTSTPKPAQPQAPQSYPTPPPTHFLPTIPQAASPTKAPNKFTGSFGGASGFLGNQQNIGTAYTSTPKPVQHSNPQTPPPLQSTHFAPTITHITNPTQAPNKFTGSFGGAPGFLGNQQNLGTAYTSTPKPIQQNNPQTPPPVQSTHFTSTHFTNPTQAPNKFTGSFGGAPGFLGSQQNLGTAYKPTTPVAPTPQRPVTFQPPPPPSQYPQSQIPNIIRPPSPFQPAPQQPHRPGQYVGNKFNGSFGGAPGLLGNQQKPGTHVKPDGTILPPSGPGLAGPSSAVTGGGIVHRPSPSATSSTFTGSFGGPPGVLRPFDNVNG